MKVIIALGVLLLVGHIATFVQTRKEKQSAPAGTKLSSSSRELVGVLMVLDILGALFFVILFSIIDPRLIMILLFFLAGALLVWLLVALVSQWFSAWRFAAWLACALLVAGGLWGVRRNDRYIESITVREDIDCTSYEPFRENSLVQFLNEPAALRFTEADALPRMDGTAELFPVYAAFCQAVYPDTMEEKDDAGFREIITCSAEADAYTGILDGNRDIIFVIGPGGEQEARAEEKSVELVYTPIGMDALVFFVHPDNPVRDLSIEELRDVYSGRIRSWDALGAADLGEILAYQRPADSNSQTAFERLVMGDAFLMTPEKEKVMTVTDGIMEQAAAYKNYPNAIGFSSRFYCTAQKDVDVKLLEINGAAPTAENIENSSYPLDVTFYAVTRSDADENTLALLDWICGEQGQELVEKAGYMPLGAGA